MPLQSCIPTSEVRMLSWSRICSFISSCICRNIFANIPALRNWWQVFYRLVKFFQRNAKIWETGKNRRGNIWYSFQGTCCSREGLQSHQKSREITSEAICYVEWPPTSAKPFPCLSFFKPLSLSLRPPHLNPACYFYFLFTFLWLYQPKTKYISNFKY